MQIKHTATQEVAAVKKITRFDLETQKTKKENLKESIIRSHSVKFILGQEDRRTQFWGGSTKEINGYTTLKLNKHSKNVTLIPDF